MPSLRNTVLDTTEPRGLAEFYRQLLGLEYRPGDEPPTDGSDDVRGGDWVVLRDPRGGAGLAFQHVDVLPQVTWPDGPVAQQLHLDITVTSRDELESTRAAAERLGATLLQDRSDDEDEPLYVLADPSAHPFCVFLDA